jgi:hypothetical protein
MIQNSVTVVGEYDSVIRMGCIGARECIVQEVLDVNHIYYRKDVVFGEGKGEFS